MKYSKKLKKLKAHQDDWARMNYGDETTKDKTGHNAKGTWYRKPGSIK